MGKRLKADRAGGSEVSRAELARLLAVSPQTVEAWVRRGLPVIETGRDGRGRSVKINTGAALSWLLERERLEASQSSPDDLDLEEARTRKTSADAELAELDVARRRGELVELDTVAELVEAAFSTVRLRMQAIPAKIAPRLATMKTAPKCRRLLEDEFEQVLGELVSGSIFAGEARERDRESGARGGDTRRRA